MKLDPYKRAEYLSFVTRSFRDIADGDYIAARISYRYELGPQFLYAGQQAIEKYLKAILLYNDQSTKKLGHDIEKAFQRLSRIKDVPFKFPKDIENFIHYLNRQGNNRYFEKPAYTTGRELLTLDRVVWHIRKYCFYLRGQTTPGPDGKRIDLFPLEIKRINNFPEEKANKYKIFNGYLEKILKKKNSKVRSHLIWKNFYYGSYQKRIIKNFKAHSWSANPSHFLHPDVFPILDKMVRFSTEVRKLFLDTDDKN